MSCIARPSLDIQQALPGSAGHPVPRAGRGRADSASARQRRRLHVLVADEEGLLRDALCALLREMPGVTRVGTAALGPALLQRAESLRPDLVITEYPGPAQGGAEIIAELKHRRPETRIVVLSFHSERNLVDAAMRAGAAVMDRAKPSRAEGSVLLGVAVQRGDGAAVKVLADRGAPIDEPDASGMRPLARAARLRDLEMVKLLIERGAAAAAVDTRGRSALWYAAGSRAAPVADLLLSMRVPVDVPDRTGATPLIASIRAGDEAMVRRLIEAGAAVDAKGAGRDPPLRVAAELGSEAVIGALLAKKPDVDATDAFGETALMAAARNGSEAVCTKLLAAGANPRLRGRDRATAGDIANSRGFSTLAKLLRG